MDNILEKFEKETSGKGTRDYKAPSRWPTPQNVIGLIAKDP